MKIYTKKGDTGETSLFGGKRVMKNHVRINAYGTVDELNAFIGYLRDQDIEEELKKLLLVIQERLFTVGSSLASDPDKNNLIKPDLENSDIALLESEIDKMNLLLPELTHFILPGGHPVVSICHITRTICRRAEREIVALQNQSYVDILVIQYMNRLSDYLFVLSRYLAKHFGSGEIYWKPRG